MFLSGGHAGLNEAIEPIGASIALLEEKSQDEFVVITANSLFEEISQLDNKHVVGKLSKEIFPQNISEEIATYFKLCIKKQTAVETEVAIDYQGSIRWWRLMFCPIFGAAGGKNRVFITGIEITDKKLLEHEIEISRKRLEAVVETSFDGIITVDKSRNIRLINGAARRMFGLGEANGIGQKLETLIPEQYHADHPAYFESFKNSDAISRPMQARVMVQGRRSDGSVFPAEVTIAKLDVGGTMEMTSAVRDVSERMNMIEELKMMAIIDPLTGAFNRRHVATVLEQEIQRSKRFGYALSVAMIDLDYFKDVNDRHGHDAGDQVLIVFTEMMQKMIREVDVFARWGGEEFIVIMPNTDISEASILAQRVIESTEALKVKAGDDIIQFTCSMGVAQYRDEKDSMENLIKRADMGLLAAKADGRNRFITEKDS